MTAMENNILLLSVTLCWASSTVFIKGLPADLPAFAYLTLTFGVAALLLLLAFFRRLSGIRRGTVRAGACLSVLLTGALLTEKLGLERLSASASGFLSSLTLVFVPLLLMLLRRWPTRDHWAGVGVMLFGLLVSRGFQLGEFFSRGTVWMICSCLFFSVYTLAADFFTKREDPLLVGILQMAFSALLSFAFWFAGEPRTFWSLRYTNEMLSAIFVLAFFANAYAYVALLFSQKYATPLQVTVITSIEPVVTLAFAICLPASFGGQEPLTARAVLGAVLIAAGAVVSEAGLFSRRALSPAREGGGA